MAISFPLTTLCTITGTHYLFRDMNRVFQILREELEFIFDKDYLHNRVELFILKAIPSLSSKEGWEPFQFFY